MAQGTSAAIEPSSPWTDDSGPDIIEIIHNPKARYLLTPANLGVLLTVRLRFSHLLCIFLQAGPGIPRGLRLVVSRSFLMNWWFVISQRGTTCLEGGGHWEESTDAICVWLRKALHFQMSFFEVIRSRFCKAGVHHPDPMGILHPTSRSWNSSLEAPWNNDHGFEQE